LTASLLFFRNQNGFFCKNVVVAFWFCVIMKAEQRLKGVLLVRIIRKVPIMTKPYPTPSCHASTHLHFPDGDLLAAWFGGSKEKDPDVRIWYSSCRRDVWSAPAKIPSEEPIPHWNPVLFGESKESVTLYYKVGYSIPEWKTMVVTSKDGGHHWSPPQELVLGDDSGGRGPVKNKPIRLSNGKLLAPASTERGVWRPFADHFDGKSWRKIAIPSEDTVNLIQPSFVETQNGRVIALLRSNNGFLYRSVSEDYGEHWSKAEPTALPNNNSGLDAVLFDGSIWLVCNPVAENWGKRTPLTLFVSKDEGKTFEKVLDLETAPGEYSYPAITAADERLFVTYTHCRETIVCCELAPDDE